MNKFAHATTIVHEENDSAIHWIQTDGIKLLLIALVVAGLYFGIKKYLSNNSEK